MTDPQSKKAKMLDKSTQPEEIPSLKANLAVVFSALKFSPFTLEPTDEAFATELTTRYQIYDAAFNGQLHPSNTAPLICYIDGQTLRINRILVDAAPSGAGARYQKGIADVIIALYQLRAKFVKLKSLQ
ncbi:hypothetical protein N7520_006485 [Penicillium odoratum]|uniref:uncharacterized protein n=1 Tax=Penicillium odoratum TaxID=1167516 RepID=UPI0025478AEA|nr:uncharacterized protein N7520_006485 [Penicillium odoratum]KAJ5759329.1 hypothetical protein N7520_006485 [Penicillium odoratum]